MKISMTSFEVEHNRSKVCGLNAIIDYIIEWF